MAQLCKPWKCFANRTYRSGTKTCLQALHWCRDVRHSITRRFIPPSEQTRSKARLTLGLITPAVAPFLGRRSSLLLHTGQHAAAMCTRAEILKQRLEAFARLARFLFNTLL